MFRKKREGIPYATADTTKQSMADDDRALRIASTFVLDLEAVTQINRPIRRQEVTKT